MPFENAWAAPGEGSCRSERESFPAIRIGLPSFASRQAGQTAQSALLAVITTRRAGGGLLHQNPLETGTPTLSEVQAAALVTCQRRPTQLWYPRRAFQRQLQADAEGTRFK